MGWIAIWLFLSVAGKAMPDLLTPPYLDPPTWSLKVALTFTLWVSLVACFWKLAVKSPRPSDSGDIPQNPAELHTRITREI